MSNLLQVVLPVVIPAAVGFLIAYQGALSRTGRLRRNVKADVELLAALPAEHPSREQLAGHVGKLVDELIWREERQYFPVVSWLRYRFGFVWFVAFTVAMVAGVVWAVLVATGVLPPGWFLGDRPTAWVAALVWGGLAAVFVYITVSTWRERRETEERARAALGTAGGGRSGAVAGPPTPDPSEGG
jgi:hypothetical protein